PLPALDLEIEAKVQRLALELARSQLVSSMHDVSDGGLAIALVECCTAVDQPTTMVGAEIPLPASPAEVVAALFSEEPSRIVASLPSVHLAEVQKRAASAGVPIVELGTTVARDLAIRHGGADLVRATLDELRSARENCLASIVGN